MWIIWKRGFNFHLLMFKWIGKGSEHTVTEIWNGEIERIADDRYDVVQLELKLKEVFFTHDGSIEALEVLSVSAAGSANVIGICCECFP